MVSPFQEEKDKPKDENKKDTAEGEKPKLPLTWDNVQAVLEDVRPYLQSDGGDCKIIAIDGSIVKLEMQGACSSCSASAVTLKMGIERSLMERIPEISAVVAVDPSQEPLSKKGIEEVLDGIRPFLSVSGGTIDVKEFSDGDKPRIVLEMSGPPLKSMAVRVEVLNRIKRKYPLVPEVDIVAAEGSAPASA